MRNDSEHPQAQETCRRQTGGIRWEIVTVDDRQAHGIPSLLTKYGELTREQLTAPGADRR